MKYLKFTILVLLALVSQAHAAKYFTDLVLQDGKLQMLERSASPSLVANYGFLYPKTDNRLYYLDDTGVEYDVLLGGNANLDDLQDVVLGTPTTGDMLRYNGVAWVDSNNLFFFDTGVGIGASPDVATIFDVTSSNRASRPCPSMTTASRDLLSTASGLCIYNTTVPEYQSYNVTSGAWEGMGGGGLDAWVTATPYATGNIVYYSDEKIYRADIAHTSGTFATDLAAARWVELSRGMVASGSIVDNSLARFDGTAGEYVQDTGILVDDSDNVVGINDLSFVGNLQTPYSTGDLIVNGTGQAVSIPLAAGQFVLGSNTVAPAAGTITGTANQITVAPGSNTIGVSLPQDIATNSNVQFGSMILGTVLDEIYGGTGNASYATGDLLYASGPTTLTRLPVASSGDFLRLSGSTPTWQTIAATGAQTIGTIDSVAGSANGASISGTSLIMQSASSATPGMVNISSQSFSGLKTFISGIIDSTLTTGRVVFTSTAGRLVDSASFLYNTATGLLTVTNVEVTTTTEATKFMGMMAYDDAPSAVGLQGYCFYASDLNSMFCSDDTNWNIQGIQPNSTAWASYTPTRSGWSGGTTECFYRVEGADLILMCTLITNTTAASEGQVGLPTGYTTASSTILPSAKAVGAYYNQETNTTHGGPVLAAAGLTYVTFGHLGTFGSTNTATMGSQNANSIGGSFSFYARVPLANSNATITNYSIKGIGTVFSAEISSTGIVTNENVDWINGNCTNANPFVCTFTSSFFTTAPSCVANTGNSSGITAGVIFAGIDAISSSSVSVHTYNSSVSSAQGAATVRCQMTGADFIANSKISASFLDKMTAPNSTNGSPNTYITTVDCDGSSTLSNETYTGTPTIGNISSGACVLTIPSGNLTDIGYVSCDFSPTEVGLAKNYTFTYTSTTSLSVACDVATVACSDFDGRLTCTQY